MASTSNPKVDAYLAGVDTWRAEFTLLRGILLASGLQEDLKWGSPCYSHEGGNVALIHGFKDYCAILFFKGALLSDPDGVLVRQTENVQAARHLRFTAANEIAAAEARIAAYVAEAKEIEASGAKVVFKDTADFAMPEEFRATLDSRPDVATAFGALTPGRQRAYLLHFAGAKQAKTRTDRIARLLPRILEGKGLTD